MYRVYSYKLHVLYTPPPTSILFAFSFHVLHHFILSCTSRHFISRRFGCFIYFKWRNDLLRLHVHRHHTHRRTHTHALSLPLSCSVSFCCPRTTYYIRHLSNASTCHLFSFLYSFYLFVFFPLLLFLSTRKQSRYVCVGFWTCKPNSF